MSKKTVSKRSAAAIQANKTRKIRDAFLDKYYYGDVAREVLRGRTNNEIRAICWVDNKTIAAVRANLNRKGAYRTAALACKF